MKKLFALVLALGIWEGVYATSIACESSLRPWIGEMLALSISWVGVLYLIFIVIRQTYRSLRKKKGLAVKNIILFTTTSLGLSASISAQHLNHQGLQEDYLFSQCPSFERVSITESFLKNYIENITHIQNFFVFSFSILGTIAILHLFSFVGKKIFKKLKKKP